MQKTDSWHLALILIYTGSGKGKTCACIGQALRALGQGLTVVFAQFIKKPDIAGEQKILSRLLGNNFRAGGLGFCSRAQNPENHIQAARDLLTWALTQNTQMLILDELLYALHYNLLCAEEITPWLDNFTSMDKHLVVSGRHCPQWFLDKADIATELLAKRHVLQKGIKAVKGIEF